MRFVMLGSSALTAGLHRVALDELAVAEGKTPLTAFWDAEKFYDNVNVVKLIQTISETLMPMRTPVLALQMHLSPRILSLQRWTSKPVGISNSIIAGCKLSNIFAEVFVYPALRKWHERYMPPSLGSDAWADEDGPALREYVDDFTLRQDVQSNLQVSEFIQSNIYFSELL